MGYRADKSPSYGTLIMTLDQKVDAYFQPSSFKIGPCRNLKTDAVKGALSRCGRLKTNDKQRGTFKASKGSTVHPKLKLNNAVIVLDVPVKIRR